MKNNAEFLAHFTQETIYLMGICFILGSLTTIFILLILDMVRRAREEIAEAQAASLDDAESLE